MKVIANNFYLIIMVLLSLILISPWWLITSVVILICLYALKLADELEPVVKKDERKNFFNNKES